MLTLLRFALIFLFLGTTCIIASEGIVESGIFYQRFIQSADHISNKYFEELLLLKSELYWFANVVPRFSSSDIGDSGNARLEGLRYHPVATIINERNQKYHDPGRFLLTGYKGPAFYDSAYPAGFRFRFTPYAQELASNDTSAIHRIGINAETWFVPDSHILVYLRARLENHGNYYSQFSGRVWDEKITGWLDNAAIYYYRNGFFGSFGRSFMVWGPEQRDALLLSRNSPAFDRLWLGYEHSHFRFDYFISKLNNVVSDGSKLVRYMSAHRLSFKMPELLELGISEVALYGGENRPLEWHYLNPFLPFYWEQWNRSSDDNIFFGADISIYWPGQCRIFSELVVDDFQIDFVSEPHQVGYKIGFDALGALGISRLFTKFSYTRVNTTTYGQNRPQNLYLHYGQPIGYFDGNDQDRLFALFRYHLNYNFDLEMELQYTRKGEGRITKHTSTAVPYEDKFPVGVVERSPKVTLGLQFFNSYLIEGNAQVSYAHFENYRNIEGHDHDIIELNLFLSWYLQGMP